jgi:CHAD domain-containing protein
VLLETFCQFTTNLNTLRISDDPEVVHQARVGWRRFKSAVRLFKPVIAADTVPSWQELELLLTCLGDLRDFDVAAMETLPPLADAYAQGDELHIEKWQTMEKVLLDATHLQRKTVRYALQEPAVGLCLQTTIEWIDELRTSNSINTKPYKKTSLRYWSRKRIARLFRQLKDAQAKADSPLGQHRVRIIIKRIRYSIEMLQTLLPKRKSDKWLRKARKQQLNIGSVRDTMQASTLLSKLDVEPQIVEFVRGFAIGKQGNVAYSQGGIELTTALAATA